MTSKKAIITEKIKKEYLKKIEAVSEGKRVALVTHKSPDPDALASTLALQHELSLRNIDTDIFGIGSFSHPQNKTLVNRLHIEVKDADFFEENKEQYALIIFCDTGKENASLKVKPDIIIDHHTESKAVSNCLIIREKTGAAATIVYLLLKSLNVKLTPELATALVIGINTDTKDLTKKDEITENDVQVHKELLSQIDYPLFAHISYRYEVPRQLISLMGEGYHDIVFDEYEAIVGLGDTKSGQAHYYAVIADFVFRVPETRLVVVVGIENGEAIRASIRTDVELVQIDDFCKHVFEADSATDTGQASAGARVGSGGAYIPLSNREREEWVVADKEEKKILFNIKLRRYKKRIKKFLEES
jgi:nanoRNase/pAp phosphatase (c-di-AMP/oligoRNAs hydrolase)